MARVGKSLVDRPWLCARCGYAMDRATSFNALAGTAPALTEIPRDAISVCLNCGAPYQRRDERWTPLNETARRALPPETRRELFLIEEARRIVVRTDLSRRGRRA